MRVLFDTNVLFAAFTAKGFCEDVADEAAGACLLVWSLPLREELEGSLQRNNKLGPGAWAALAAYAQLCEFVVPAALSAPACRDPDDDVVLATALSGRADNLVTGDDDLLTLARYHGIRILSPREFWEVLAA
ncbi:MAG: putative toxin-antitoxin system toxin component, PIN family [Terracidiphilus sp.]